MSRSPTDSDDTPSVSAVSTASVLESIPDAVLVADMDTGNVVRANDAAGTLFECRPEQLVGRDHTALHPPENIQAYTTAFRSAFEKGSVDRLEDGSPIYIETDQGERKPVEINTQQLDADGQTLVLAVFREIGDRLHRERRLRETTTRLETLLDALPLPVSVLDTDGTVQLWNQAAEETFGYTSGELLDTRYPLFTDDEEYEELFAGLLDADIVDGYETTHRAKDGSVLDVELHARPLFADEEITGVIGTAIDVTEQKQRTQRLDVLHRVLRHNLRNRLSVIRGFANELDFETESDAADEILEASDSLVDLAETAAETRKRIKQAQRRTDQVPLAELVATLETSVEAVTVQVRTEPDSEPILVPEQSEQVFDWLLSYIDDYTTDPSVEVAIHAEQRHVSLFVRGDEQLLDEGAMELIENGQETSLRHGSGLDIPQVYLVLTAIGGTISPTSDVPSGRGFHIELPQVDPE